MNKKNLLWVVVILLLVISGCSIFNDMWPVRKSKVARKYVGKDTEGCPITTLAEEKEVRTEVVQKHVLTQLELKYQVSVDKANYDTAMEIDNNITIAETERDKLIGTVEEPGYLMALLLSATGLGLYGVGKRTQRPEDYNEAEMKAEVAERVAVELAKLKG
jgi:hypothetical protein